MDYRISAPVLHRHIVRTQDVLKNLRKRLGMCPTKLMSAISYIEGEYTTDTGSVVWAAPKVSFSTHKRYLVFTMICCGNTRVKNTRHHL